MEINGWIIGSVIAALLIGGILGAVLFPKEVTVEKVIEKEVPVEKTIEVEVEKEIPMDIEKTYLKPAIDEVINYMDDEDLFTCGGDDYDKKEVSVNRIYDEWSIAIGEDDYEVCGAVKLKYKEEGEKSCREKIDFCVYYEEDEDPVVSII